MEINILHPITTMEDCGCIGKRPKRKVWPNLNAIRNELEARANDPKMLEFMITRLVEVERALDPDGVANVLYECICQHRHHRNEVMHVISAYTVLSDELLSDPVPMHRIDHGNVKYNVYWVAEFKVYEIKDQLTGEYKISRFEFIQIKAIKGKA